MAFGDAADSRHDLPRGTEAALQAIVLDECTLERMKLAIFSRPSIVSISAPSCIAANVRHDTIRLPFRRMVRRRRPDCSPSWYP